MVMQSNKNEVEPNMIVQIWKMTKPDGDSMIIRVDTKKIMEIRETTTKIIITITGRIWIDGTWDILMMAVLNMLKKNMLKGKYFRI